MAATGRHCPVDAFQTISEELTAEQRDTLVTAHALWFSYWLQGQEPFLVTGRQNELLSAIQAEHDNLRASWQGRRSTMSFRRWPMG